MFWVSAEVFVPMSTIALYHDSKRPLFQEGALSAYIGMKVTPLTKEAILIAWFSSRSRLRRPAPDLPV
jgi:hypothetical protein